ncbi:aminotransferase class V-fold PLP-dependent enzyme [Paracoccaceae bacterium]|nr:aminotransferase class V-fold PLP-dependent enzyme [Paracoccaceae bacterium]
MLHDNPDLLKKVRQKFAHIEECPFEGKRVFFENAGGALTLNSVVETSAKFAAIPDNQGRANKASQALVDIINKSKEDMSVFFGTDEGSFIVGESGTEILFRLIRSAIMGSEQNGIVLGSTLEHPASVSACKNWAEKGNKKYVSVNHDNDTGSVSANAYLQAMTPDVRVATIIHTSPVTGMTVNITDIVDAIRTVSPECFIIVDGIQHAAHGGLDLKSYGVDGYAVSPYKMFSRHGYGVGWLANRLQELPHENLIGGPVQNWELGTRDTGAYATFSDVVDYLDWLGAQVSNESTKRDRVVAAGKSIHEQEKVLTDAMIYGVGNLTGLANLSGIGILGGKENALREGLVSITIEGMNAEEVVEALRENGIRVHARKADHYSGNILKPLNLESCTRVSMCHYNTIEEVADFLTAMRKILD